MAGHLRLRWRGQPRHAVHQRRGAGDRAPEGEAGRDAARARVAGRQDRCPGGQPPFGPPAVASMSRTVSPASGRPYGLARVCRVWRASRASVYRHLSSPRRGFPGGPGPVGPMADAALVEAIQAVLTASPFHGEGHRKVWARLRVAGVRTSKRRVLRLMRENNLLAPTRAGVPRGPRSHDGTIIPEAVDTMWGTDLTTTLTGEGQVAVFVAIDHCSAACVGIHAARRATRFAALEPLRQAPRPPWAPPFGAGGADPAGRPSLLRGFRQRDRARSRHPARSREPIHVRRLPEGARLLGHREFARLRAGPRGEWLRRALSPHTQREPALGAPLRHRRGAPSGAARFSGALQHDLAHRTARVSDTRGHAAEPAFTRRTGCVRLNPVSHKSGAVQFYTALGEFIVAWG